MNAKKMFRVEIYIIKSIVAVVEVLAESKDEAIKLASENISYKTKPLSTK